MIITSVFTVAMLVARVAGHGYLMDPPARNSAWRVDPDSHEPNYTDNEQNCGGFEVSLLLFFFNFIICYNYIFNPVLDLRFGKSGALAGIMKA